MSNLLYQFLEKRGIKSRDGLSDPEKATFEKWEKIFQKEININNIIDLVNDSIETLQRQWMDLEEKNPISFLFYWKEQLYIKARIKNLMIIKDLVSSNKNNKASLENYLKDLLNK